MIIIPDTLRKLIKQYIVALKDLQKRNHDMKKEINNAISNLSELYIDLDDQKMDLFKGEEKDVISNVISYIEEYNEIFSHDEKFYYFSELNISVEEGMDFSHEMLIIARYMAKPESNWCDGGQVEGYKREFHFVKSMDSIPEIANELPTNGDNGFRLFYRTRGMHDQLTEEEYDRYFKEFVMDKNEYLEHDYQKWYGVCEIGVYYVLIQ